MQLSAWKNFTRSLIKIGQLFGRNELLAYRYKRGRVWRKPWW